MVNNLTVKPLILSVSDIQSSGGMIPDIRLSCYIRNENRFSICLLNSWIEISDNKGIHWAKGPLLHTLHSLSEPALIKSGEAGLGEICFQLAVPTLKEIEARRKGDDIELGISSRIIVSKAIDGPNGTVISVPFETSLVLEGSSQFKYHLPKSKWIELYNTFGLSQIELIEIDFGSGDKSIVFKRALDHLRKAREAYLQNEYENVLLNCRKLQEAFVQDSNQREGMKDTISAIEKAVNDKRKAKVVNEIISNIAKFLHFGRHESHPPMVINRRDAELAIQLNSALLSYLIRYDM